MYELIETNNNKLKKQKNLNLKFEGEKTTTKRKINDVKNIKIIHNSLSTFNNKKVSQLYTANTIFFIIATNTTKACIQNLKYL